MNTTTPKPQDVGFDVEWWLSVQSWRRRKFGELARSGFDERKAMEEVAATQVNPALDTGDAEQFLMLFGGAWKIGATWHHRRLLARMGMLERCVVISYISAKFDNRSWHSTIMDLFDLCDPVKLKEAADPLPPGDVFTIYRGVNGRGGARRPSGASWSLSPGVAAWFACRELQSPAVYIATIPRDAVLFYTNEREEREIVTLAARPNLWCKDPDRLRALAEEYRAEIKAATPL
jgi:hypothetical protein